MLAGALVLSQTAPLLPESLGGFRVKPGRELDAADRRLLAVLQQDAALSINALAERVNLSPNASWRRVRLLEQDGYVLRRVALLDPDRLGVPATVFVSIRAAEHSEEWVARFATVVSDMPEVLEFYRMSGEVDYLLKLQVADIAHYDRVYRRLIQAVRLPSVTSAFAMETLKRTTALPV
jgi:Lrp/AsnC family transcriptional regulator